jgi:glycosyltransferase involved in cell wall biosynthesis
MLRHLRQHEGGVKVYTSNLLDALLALDRENEYVFLYQDRRLVGSYAAYANVKEVAVPVPSKLVWDQLVAPAIAQREDVDVLFNPKFSVPLVWQRPSVFVLQGSDWFVMPQNQRWHDRVNHRVLTPLYCRKARAIISISNSVKRDVVHHLKLDGEKVKLVYYGLDHAIFHPVRDQERLRLVRARYRLPDRFILYVGQIYPAKNFGGILRAFARVRGNLPHKLVVAGEPRWKYTGEIRLIAELGLEQDVLFTGWVPQSELPEFYSLADLFLFPSTYEGFGMPLIEAMACGCPIVTSTTGSCPEVVSGAALLAEPADVGCIAQRVLEALTNRELRRQLVEKGLRRAQDFSWEKCARATLAVLTSLDRAAGERHRRAA